LSRDPLLSDLFPQDARVFTCANVNVLTGDFIDWTRYEPKEIGLNRNDSSVHDEGMHDASSPPSPDRAGSADPEEAAVLAIAAMLRRERLRQGLTLRELKQRMRVSHGHISRVERGVSLPTILVLARWCKALNVRLADVWQKASGEE
jgi:ribosome-binding protein aMBF1 (putative translation factor)